MTKIPDLKADKTAVDLKADKTAVDLKADKTAVDLKADKTEVDLKADKTEVDLKADKTEVDLKADKTEVDLKADKTAVDLKADKTAVDLKADKTEVDLKADKTAVDLKADKTEVDLKADKTALDAKADKTASDLKADITALNLKADQTALALKADITALDLKADKTALDPINTALNKITTPSSIGKIPTSCGDLKTIGFVKSGIFSIMDSKRVKNVYCDFTKTTDAELQKMIGTVDVKSAPVHFQVQRNSPFNTTGTPIPFNFARVNEGNAMDLTSGKFTAPRPGIYFFSFTALARLESSSFAWYFSVLYLNGISIGSNFVQENRGPVDQLGSLTLQSTLKLGKGDQVWVQIWYTGSSFLQDNGNHHTHFTGFMLEDIFDSL